MIFDFLKKQNEISKKKELIVIMIQSINISEYLVKDNFSNISWMRKKEAEEKTKEMNSFSFLLHNL